MPPESVSTRRVARFGVFEADLELGELRRDGRRLPLQELPFQVLAALLEQPGREVSREELRRRLWPDRESLDFENGINTAVGRLRQALGDSAENPRFIGTRRGRGYRFVAPVRVLAKPAALTAAAPPLRRSHRSSVLRWTAVAATVLAVAIGTPLTRTSPRQKAPTRVLMVLPLENLSGDPSQRYLADGITEALTTDLARMNLTRVISRRSADYYSHTKEPLKRVAGELGADLVVEGSVLRDGDRVRITAQLLDAALDQHLWAQSYERSADDVLQLQQEVAAAIASQIAVRTPTRAAAPQADAPVTREAYDHYLHGRFLLRQRQQSSYESALAEFQAAAQSAPGMPLAYVGMAQAYNLMGFSMGGGLPRDVAAARAKEAARKALALDPDCAEAHAELAFTVSRFDSDGRLAEEEFVRAIEINPNESVFHHWYGIFLAVAGRVDEAAAQYDAALQLDPMSPNIRRANGMLLLKTGKTNEAIAESQRAVELAPTQFNVRISLAHAYLRAGRFSEAIAEGMKAVDLSHGLAFTQARLAEVYAGAGDHAAAEELLGQLERKKACPYLIALIHASLHHKDETLQALESG